MTDLGDILNDRQKCNKPGCSRDAYVNWKGYYQDYCREHR